MKRICYLVLVFFISLQANASDHIFNNKHIGVNLGLGVCIDANSSLDPDLCFHGGIDYLIDEDMSMIGFRYHKFNWTDEYSLTIIDKTITKQIDIDMDAYQLYYRFPLGDFTLALGPGMMVYHDQSEFAVAGTIGYLNNPSNYWGFELAGTTFYRTKYEDFYIYLYGGIRVYL